MPNREPGQISIFRAFRTSFGRPEKKRSSRISRSGFAYCFSHTIVKLVGFPLVFMPFIVTVVVFPSLETTVVEV